MIREEAPINEPERWAGSPSGEKGVALIMVMFVLALLTGMGLALLFTADVDVQMNLTDLRSKQVFFIAEAGLEFGREAIRAENSASPDPRDLDEELIAHAGANGVFDATASSLAPVYDASGNVTGFTGAGDDVPIDAYTTFGGGWYASYVANDPADPIALDDTNSLVLVTAIGAGPDRSVEIVEAVVELDTLPTLPSSITMLGPSADFDGGSSTAKTYDGDDCDGATGYTGIPGLSVPTVGTVGSASEAVAEAGVIKPTSYDSGGATGTDTVDDVSGVLDPTYVSCTDLVALGAAIRSVADHICTVSSPCSHWTTSTVETITFVEGDVTLNMGDSGKGILWVTGTLTTFGNPDWEGVIYVVGEGDFIRSGGGSGHTYGAMLLAGVSGADGDLFTGDDCTGPLGGFDVASYTASGGGTHDVVYCSDAINQAQLGFPLRIVDFRQH